ncbi:hypothetical protein HWV62_36334 [Athelia sp. TMB]|nr:hypothetical protein HWV62_36334 [Athelia sp. TMB]
MAIHNNLLGPPDSHYVNRTMPVMERKSVPIVDPQRGDTPVTVTWTVDLHIYPTGAYLDNSDPGNADKENNIKYWEKHGQIHVVAIHSGTIEQPNANSATAYTLTTKITNPEARAKQQLPRCAADTKDGLTTYSIDWSERMLAYSGEKPTDFSPSYLETFTHPKSCQQEASCSGQETEIILSLLLNNDGGNGLPYQMGVPVEKADIYGLSHFVLKAGDYKDVYLDFTFRSSHLQGGNGSRSWKNHETTYNADKSWGTELDQIKGYVTTRDSLAVN